MRKNLYILLVVLFSSLTYGQTPNTNYTHTVKYKTPVIDGNQSNVLPTDKVEQIIYFDGQGRPIQAITPNAGGNLEEIISVYEYDALGRQEKKYLPFATTAMTPLDTVSGVLTSLNAYYQNKFPADFQNGVNPYSEVVFENSPAGRVLKQGAPGSDWKIDAVNPDHTVKFNYGGNEDNDIYSFDVDYDVNGADSIAYRGYYKKNQLYRFTTKNENWQSSDGKSNTTETYKDKGGRTILSRNFNKNSGNDEAYDTYYIYDDYGNLTFVLPPKASETLVVVPVGYPNTSETILKTELLTVTPGGAGSTGNAATVSIVGLNEFKIVFNFSVPKGRTLRTGIIKTLVTPVPDVILGNITNGVYNFQVAVQNNALVITDIAGIPFPDLTNYNATLSVFLPTESTLPPIESTLLNTLCYQYKYDTDNRMMEKRIPGKEGWESVVYDKLSRPVLSQDVNQKANNKWMFVKYDVFGRIIYSGEYTDSRTRQEIQDQIDGESSPILFETKQPTDVVIGDASARYSNTMFPSTNLKLFSVIYYDNYEFDKAGFTVPAQVYSEDVTANTKTLVTGSKVRTLETANWATTVIAYDEKARPIKVQSKNDYLQTTDVIETDLDFVGNVIENKSVHSKTGIVADLTTYDYFTYDHAGRLLKQTQKIGNNALELISYNKYNDLGQLVEQKIGGDNGSATTYTAATALQKIDYGFNVRGWLTKINNTSDLSSDGDLFAYEIKYNNPTATGIALFNGNISQTFWKTTNDGNLRNYSYTYDNLNRIKQAKFYNDTNTAQNDSFNLESINYDKNGNILSLHSAGDKEHQPDLAWMDVMNYYYEGNKLLRIKDDGNNYFGFTTQVPGTDEQPQYSYDNNGNLTADRNKNITAITYNHLNLPLKITFSGTSKYIDFVYNAAGQKQSKTIVNGGDTTMTYYAGSHTYQKVNAGATALQFIAQPQGYAYPDNGTYRYVYQYKDQVGNTRLSYMKNTAGQLVIVEENHYSPFGMKHSGYGSPTGSLGNSVAQKYKYNGKESEEAFGLNVTEMDFRQYDPAIGRFFGIDLLAESSYDVTPYHFTENNPILFGDPSGLKRRMSHEEAPRLLEQPQGGFLSYFGNTEHGFLWNLQNGGPSGGGNGNGGPAGYGFGTGYNGVFDTGWDAIMASISPFGYWKKVWTGGNINGITGNGLSSSDWTNVGNSNEIANNSTMQELVIGGNWEKVWVSTLFDGLASWWDKADFFFEIGGDASIGAQVGAGVTINKKPIKGGFNLASVKLGGFNFAQSKNNNEPWDVDYSYIGESGIYNINQSATLPIFGYEHSFDTRGTGHIFGSESHQFNVGPFSYNSQGNGSGSIGAGFDAALIIGISVFVQFGVR